MNVDAAVEKTDLVDLANTAGANLKRQGGEWRGCCPIHGGDNETGFVVYQSGGKQKWHCFTRDCGGGDAIDFVMAHRRLSFPDAVKYLGGDDLIDPVEIARIALERSRRQQEALEEQIKLAQSALADLRAADAHLQYHANLDAHGNARDLWRKRGVPDYWQDHWQLGYRPSYKIHTKSGWWTTPTLTIPIYGQDRELLNIRHRLLNPFSQHDKYRPERAGLGAMPFVADPDTWFDIDRVLIVEGEIKAMVAYLCADDNDLQVIGIPGKSSIRNVQEWLSGHTVYILLDPDAREQAMDFARDIGARFMQLPMKIDDAVLAGALDKRGLRALMAGARMIR
jgi:hypothetical protein